MAIKERIRVAFQVALTFGVTLTTRLGSQEPLLVVAAREETARTLMQLMMPDTVRSQGQRYFVVVERYCGIDDLGAARVLVTLAATRADTALSSVTCSTQPDPSVIRRGLVGVTASGDTVHIGALPGMAGASTMRIPALEIAVEGRQIVARPQIAFGKTGIAVGFFRVPQTARVDRVQQRLHAIEEEGVANLLLYLPTSEATAMAQALEPFPTPATPADTVLLGSNRIQVGRDKLEWGAQVQRRGARYRLSAKATWTGRPLRMSGFEVDAVAPSCNGLTGNQRTDCLAVGIEARFTANLLKASVSNGSLGHPLILLKGGKDWKTTLFGRAIRIDAQGTRTLADSEGVSFFGYGFIERR